MKPAFKRRKLSSRPVTPSSSYSNLAALNSPSLESTANRSHLLEAYPDPLLIFVNKGLEVSTNQLPIEIIADELSAEQARRACFLSGPSFAKESSSASDLVQAEHRTYLWVVNSHETSTDNRLHRFFLSRSGSQSFRAVSSGSP